MGGWELLPCSLVRGLLVECEFDGQPLPLPRTIVLVDPMKVEPFFRKDHKYIPREGKVEDATEEERLALKGVSLLSPQSWTKPVSKKKA